MAAASYPDLDPAFAADRYGPWAVIAGASDGSGECFARQLAALKLNTVLVSRRADRLDALAGELRRDHGTLTRTLAVDLSDDDAGARMLDATADLDVGLYIANAGAGGGSAGFLDHPAERWRRLIALNAGTVVDATHGYGKRMKARGRGGILLMGSHAALGGQPGFALYGAVKAFSLSFAESMWVELGAFGIDVLSVLAPAMDTPTFRRGIEGTNFDPAWAYDPAEVARAALSHLPHGPMLVFDFGPDLPKLDRIRADRRERLAIMTAFTAQQLDQK
jgi:short-subunit dehydrogenase